MEEGLARMSAAEFAEWMAFDSLEPIGQRREDLRMAVLAALIANQWRGKDTEPYKPADMLKLLPWWDEKRERAAVNAPQAHKQGAVVGEFVAGIWQCH